MCVLNIAIYNVQMSQNLTEMFQKVFVGIVWQHIHYKVHTYVIRTKSAVKLSDTSTARNTPRYTYYASDTGLLFTAKHSEIRPFS